jgi:phospholipid/cholesterol/gamma-HCH transport system ATP-binding protein
VIEFRGVKKAFGGKPVLRGIDLSVGRGEVFFIIGTSGVGKSVTIKHLVGLIRPDAGEILLDGERVDHLPERELFRIRKRCGMVFQNSTLFDSLSILENVALPLRKHRRLSQRDAEAGARVLLSRVHMDAFADRYPAELGDGMRKRAAIARTLTLEPEAVLFDEPTTGLDPISARRIDRLIRQLADTMRVTSIVVSHDLESIFTIADRIAFLYQGVVHKCGTPKEFRESDDPVVQQFIRGESRGQMETPGF